MAGDYGAINGERIDFYEIDGGPVATEMAADHSISINQTLDLRRDHGIEAAHNFTFDQALPLRLSSGVLCDHLIQIDMVPDVDQLFPMVIRHTITFVTDVDVEHFAFNRWRLRERLRVPVDFRGMLVPEEPRRTEVLP